MSREDIFTTEKRYEIIYADPPWKYHTYSEKGQGRGAEQHYPTMSLEEIKALPVPKICKKDAVLLLWVTSPCLLQGIELLSAWGFSYKTVAFTWMKQCKKSDNLFTGMGYYTRANAEYCLLGTRGKPLPRVSHSVSSAVLSHIERHSKKPDEVRKRITDLFGDRPRIELFAREFGDGWDCWGNEV